MLEFEREHGIIAGIDKHRKAFGDQPAGGFQGLDGMRQEGLVVGEDFEFDHVAQAQFAAEQGGADSVFGGEAAGGIGQQLILATDVVEERAAAAARFEVGPAHGYSHHVAARFSERQFHALVVGVLAGADQQPRAEGKGADGERRNRGRQHGCRVSTGRLLPRPKVSAPA